MHRVSIIAACLNEGATLEHFLSGALLQTIPCEIVIADGMSVDGTRSILAAHAGAIRWIDNPRRITSAGLNRALQESTGEIVVRMDAHTRYSPDYVASCLAVLAETGASNVGGPARTEAAGFWQRAIALAFSSPFFTGGARFHDAAYEGPVDTVPYGCWCRSDLEALGGFDEALVRNQDDELNFRIQLRGGTVWQSPRIRSWYTPRKSLAALAHQYYEYGFWKVAVMRKHGRPAQVRHVVPGLVLVALSSLTVASLVSARARSALLTALAMYAAASSVASVHAARSRDDVVLLPALPLVFGTVHLAYACGLAAAFLQGKPREKAC